MRTFAAPFAAEIAGDAIDEFRTAVFYFPSAGTKYLADRPVTVSGHQHTALVTEWGDIGSTLDRFGQSLDVVTTDLVLNNFPNADFSDERFGAVLREESHAVRVELYENVIVSGTAYQELLFEGVAKGPADRSYQSVRVQAVGLTEKYLNGNACRTITAEDFPSAADAAIGDTVPWIWGRVPRVRGRVVKRGFHARPTYTLGAGSTGQLDWNVIQLWYTHHIQVYVGDEDPTEIAQFQTIRITFTSATAFDVEVDGFSPPEDDDPEDLGSGTVNDEFRSDREGNAGSNYLVIPPEAWSGVFQSGDEIEIEIDRGTIVGTGFARHRAGTAQVIIGESHTDAPITDTKRMYWDGVPVLFEDLDGGGGAADIPLVLDGADTAYNEREQSHYLYPDGSLLDDEDAPDPDGATGVLSWGDIGGGDTFNIIAQEFTTPLVEDPQLVIVNAAIGGLDDPNQVSGIVAQIRPRLPEYENFLNTEDTPIATRRLEPDMISTNTPFGNAITVNSLNLNLEPGRKYYMTFDSMAGFTQSGSVGGVEQGKSPKYQSLLVDLTAPDTGDTHFGQDGKLYGFDDDTNSWVEIAGKQLLYEQYWRSNGGDLGGDFDAPSPITGTYVFPLDFQTYGRLIDRIRLGVGEVTEGAAATEPIKVEIIRGRTADHGESIVAIEISAASYNYAIANNEGDIYAFLREDGPVFFPPGLYWLKISGTLEIDDDGTQRGVTLLAGSGSPIPLRGAVFTSYKSQPLATADDDAIFGDFTLYTVPFSVDDSVDDGTGNLVAMAYVGAPIPDGVEITFDVDGSYPDSGVHPNRVIKFMHERAGVPDARLDLLDDDEASFGTTYRFNGVLEDPGLSWKQAILRAAFECRCAYTWPRDKPMLLFLPEDAGTADATVELADIVARDKVPELSISTTSVEDTVNSIDVRWARDWTQGRSLESYAETTHVEDATAISANGVREKPDLFMFDYVRSAAMASALAAFYLDRYAEPADVVTYDTKLPALALERVDQVGFAADVDLIDTAARFMLTGWRLKAPGQGRTRLTLQGEQL